MKVSRLFDAGMLFCGLWLMACAGVQGPGGAANSGGGPLGGQGESPISGGAAAQPMDTGFSGPKKDIDNIHYAIRGGKARVLCQSSPGISKLRFEGSLVNQQSSGEATSATAFLRLTDPVGEKFLVTHTSMDVENLGYFQVEFKAGSAEAVHFDYLQDFSGPLDTILPLESVGINFITPVEFNPALIVEEGPWSSRPCMEKVEEPKIVREQEE